MSFKYRHRKLIIIAIITISIIGISLALLINKKDLKKQKVTKVTKENIEINTLEKKKEESKEEYMVDIKGEVVYPGMYSLSSESRIIDVIQKAGGLTENANTTVINLSKKIIDEMVIIIYSNEEVENFKKTKEEEKEIIDSCIQKDEESLVNDACIETTESVPDSSGKVSLNNATREELMSIPGIGLVKALEIIKYREKNGGFTDIEQIKEIKGIGESTFAKIKDYITL